MTHPRPRLVLALLALLVLATAIGATGGVNPAAVLLHAPDGASQPHPLAQKVKLAIEDRIGAVSWACVEYGNTLAAADSGQVKAQLEVRRQGRVVVDLTLKAQVRGNHAVRCAELGTALQRGDLAVFKIRYRDFPRLGSRDAYVAFAGFVPR